MEILINNQLLDGIVNSDIAISKALNNLHEVKARVGDFSTQIRTFKTQNNQAIAEQAHLIGAGSNVPYSRNEAIIRVDGCQAIRGFAVLEESDEFYNWRVYGGNADLFNLIKDRKLEDLNLSRFDHNWQDDEVIANRSNYSSWLDGYIYADIDYGKWTELSYQNVLWKDLYPAVHAKMIIWQMCIDAGYTPAGSFWESNELFSREIVPFTRNSPNYSDLFRAQKFCKIEQSNSDYDITITAGAITGQLMLLNTKSGGWAYNNANGEVTVTENSFDLEFTAKGRLRLGYSCPSSGTYLVAAYFFVYRGASIHKTITQTKQFNLAAGTGTLNLDVDLSFTELFYTDKVKCQVTIQGTNPPHNLTWTSAKFLQGGYISFNLGKKGYPGCRWSIASNLPDMKQSEYLSTILNQFAVLIDCDSRLKVARFIELNDIESNKLIAPNWSNKVDLSKNPVVKYKLNGYAQRNVFRYQEDDKDKFLIARQEVGAGVIHVANKLLDAEKVVFESKFAPVWVGSSFNGVATLAQIQMFDGDKENSIKPRIALINVAPTFEGAATINIIKDTSSNKANYIFGTGGGAVVNATRLFNVEFNGLRFDTSLLPSFYQPLLKMLDKTIVLELYINLKPVDVELLQLDVPVYIDIDTETHGQICGYFYINLVDQFQVFANSSTKLGFIKI